MKIAEVNELAEHKPFRPFTERLDNGAAYTFSESRNFGAPKNYAVVFHLGDTSWTMLDLDGIAEVTPQFPS